MDRLCKRILSFILSAVMLFCSTELLRVTAMADPVDQQETTSDVQEQDQEEIFVEADVEFEELSTEEVSMKIKDLEDKLREFGKDESAEKDQVVLELQELMSTYDYASAFIENEYLEIAMTSSGVFTIGTEEGNPNYQSDNNVKLLYGHPSPSTSETMIVVDGSAYWFSADSYVIDSANNKITSTMTLSNYSIVVTQTLSFMYDSATGRSDMVKISYHVLNGSSESHSVGVRIMMDTMLHNNDHAPFKVSGYGNVTTGKVLEGSSITQTYQVYDDLDNPTTIASGVLWLENDRRPDKVQYCNWGNVRGSSWNHVVNDGDYLGDSAVAIYFNPVNITAGAGINVNTYYGTGIGLGGGSDTEVNIENQISGQDYILYVSDSSTDDMISGATVSINGLGTATTDSTGKAVFKNVPDSINSTSASCTISHTDYQTKTENVTIVRGSCGSVQIKKNTDTQPMVESVIMTSANSTYNNVNLLTTNAYFNSNDSNITPNRANSDEITITATSDLDDCVYQLISDSSVIAESDTGVFTMNVLKNDGAGKTFTTGRICELSAGKKVYLQVVSSTGEVSQKRLLGIKVSAPTTVATNLTNNVTLGFELDFSALGDAAELCNILFGTKNLELKEGKALPLKVNIDETGKVRVAYNMYQKDWKTTEDNYAKMVANRSSAAKAFGGSPSSFGFKNAKLDFNVAGYGEGFYSNGAITVNLGIYATLSGSADYTHTFFVGWVPVYIKVGVTGELNAELGATIVNNGKLGLSLTTGKFEPSISVFAEVGAGVSGVLSAGVRGTGTLKYLYDILNNYHKVTLSGSASIEVKAFLYSNSIQVAQGTWTLYDNYRPRQSNSISQIAGSDNYYDPGAFKLISRDYLNLGNQTQAVENEVLEDGVYTDSKPVIVKAGDDYYRFWIDDDTSRTSMNRTALMYSKFDAASETWSDRVIVDPDNTGDFAYNVAVSGSDIYIVMQEMSRTYTDEDMDEMITDSESGLATMAADSIVSMFKITGSEITDFGTISTGTEINGNLMGAMAPRIAVADDTATVIWTSNSANDVLASDKEATNYIWYTTADISAAEQVAFADLSYIETGITPVTSLDIGLLNGQVKVAYVVDVDQDLTTLSDRELYLAADLDNDVTTAKVTQETSNVSADENPVFAKINGEDCLVWFEGGNFCYTNTTIEEAKYVFGIDNVPTSTNNAYAVLEGENATAIVWNAASSIMADGEFSQSLYAVKNLDGQWGNMYELTEITANGNTMISSLSGYLDAYNMCHVGFSAVSYDESTLALESSTIELVTEDERFTADLLAVNYDMNEAYAGNTTDVVVTLKNTGTKDIYAAEISVASFSTAVDFADDPLQVGEERDIVFEVTLDQYDTANEYPVSVIVYDETYYYTYANVAETPYMQCNYTDIAVEQGDSTIVGNAEYFNFHISNNSNIPAENVNFKILLDDSSNGTIVLDEHIGTVGPGESTTVMFRTDLLQHSQAAYGRLATTTNELTTYNNEELICGQVEVPDVIDTYLLTVTTSNTEAGSVVVPDGFTAGANGTYSKACETNEAVTVTAVPASDIWEFTGWEVTGNGTVTDKNAATTTFYMGDSDATLRATFKTRIAMTAIGLPANLTLSFGETVDITTDSAYQLAPSNTSDFVIWSSDDESVVTIDEDGYLCAVGMGTATITATSSGNDQVTATCTVTVTDVAIERLRAVYPSITLGGIGSTDTLSIIKTPNNATEAIRFVSDNPNVVSVDENGVVTAVGPGTATITVTSASGAASASVTVTVSIPLEGIYFNPSSLQMIVGNTTSVVLNMNPVNTTAEFAPEEIQWTTSNSYVVSVVPADDHKSATLIAGGAGSATITVAIGDNYRATMTVSCMEPIEEEIVDCVTGLESEHEYGNSMDKYWSYTVPEATSLIVTFDSKTLTESSYDYIHVYDANFNDVESGSGSYFANRTVVVSGDTVKIRLTSDGSVTRYGFKVKSVEPRYADGVRHTYVRNYYKATVSNDGYEREVCSECGYIKSLSTFARITDVALSDDAYTYTGYPYEPGVTVTDADGNVINDYFVQYIGDCTMPGRHNAKIVFTGNYIGVRNMWFEILPDSPDRITATLLNSNKLKIKWTNAQGANYYKVYLWNYEDGEYDLLETTHKISYVLTDLEEYTTYRFMVVPCVMVGGVEYEGNSVTVRQSTESLVDAVSYAQAPVHKTDIPVRYATKSTTFVITENTATTEPTEEITPVVDAEVILIPEKQEPVQETTPVPSVSPQQVIRPIVVTKPQKTVPVIPAKPSQYKQFFFDVAMF